MADQRQDTMNKESAVIRYAATMAVFKKWLAMGVIGEDEWIILEKTIAEKYGLSFRSIYRQNA